MPRQNMSTVLQTSQRGKMFMNMAGATQSLMNAERTRNSEAAQRATAVSRATFVSKLSGRPYAAPRPGRPSTMGNFAHQIEWRFDGYGPSAVGQPASQIAFDYARLPYYWIINEIGTNAQAAILNPPGSIHVASQVGRLISAGLFWASGPGGNATSATTGSRSDQLYLASDLNANSLHKGRRKRIRRQIRGKHFVQAGGIEGFAFLADALKADAQRIFLGR